MQALAQIFFISFKQWLFCCNDKFISFLCPPENVSNPTKLNMILSLSTSSEPFIDKRQHRTLLNQAPHLRFLKASPPPRTTNIQQGGHGTGKTGKTGNLVLTFSRQGKHREFCSGTGKNLLTQGKYLDCDINIRSMFIFLNFKIF